MLDRHRADAKRNHVGRKAFVRWML